LQNSLFNSSQGYLNNLRKPVDPIHIQVDSYFSTESKMIAQIFVFTRDFVTERNTDCLSEGRKFLVGTKIKQGLVILVRNAG